MADQVLTTRLAPAKVNLALHVTGRRADGYHLLDSIVVFTDFGDTISLQEGIGPLLTIAGPYGAGLGVGDDNLICRAATAIADKLDRSLEGLQLHLEKKLPVEAGVGGGSADAAATLHLLNDHWGRPLSFDQLIDLGLALGADVPVCLAGRSMRMSGIGEQLAPLNRMGAEGIVLINPGVGVPTGKVFSALDGRYGDALGDVPAKITTDWLATKRNDLERPAMSIAIEIGDMLSTLNQVGSCRLARMSGSGATVFGLFDSREIAVDAARIIRSAHPDWWVQGGGLLGQ